MQSKRLTKLLEEPEQELMRLGYTEGSLKFYRRRWKMLLDFAKFQLFLKRILRSYVYEVCYLRCSELSP